ncbi:hypothetical protein B0H17DRAFT_907622, partial [Mycena rosella]
RRPLSPSSLRDVDLSHTPDTPARRYPAPPTGHDLMALFPPAAPDNSAALRAGPTSGYFQRQERAFFAQAGREIVRVRVDVDVTPPPHLDKYAAHPEKYAARAPPPPHTPHGHPPSQAGTPMLQRRTPPPDGGDEFRTDDPDEAWRRPMPYNERRRAGKHTRRVVV